MHPEGFHKIFIFICTIVFKMLRAMSCWKTENIEQVAQQVGRLFNLQRKYAIRRRKTKRSIIIFLGCLFFQCGNDQCTHVYGLYLHLKIDYFDLQSDNKCIRVFVFLAECDLMRAAYWRVKVFISNFLLKTESIKYRMMSCGAFQLRRDSQQ